MAYWILIQELEHPASGSIAVLLVASLSASTAISVMVELLKKCFNEEMSTATWQSKLIEMIPSFGQEPEKNAALLYKVRAYSAAVLRLQD